MKIKLEFHGYLKKYNEENSSMERDVPDNITVRQFLAKTGVPLDEIAFPSVNGSRVELTQTLQDGDEVKLFQLVGGG